MNYDAISLFSSSEIGDLGLKENGIKTVIACELLETSKHQIKRRRTIWVFLRRSMMLSVGMVKDTW